MKSLLICLSFLLAASAGLAQSAARPVADNKKNYIHRLQLGDRVRVAIYQEDDLLTVSRIDARGRINLPLVGEIPVGNLTIVEAQDAIQQAYRDGRFLRSPQVTISVDEYAPRIVSVMGAVRNPGQIPLPNESTYTVVEVITKSGGISDIGKGTAVSVTRVNADGTKQVFTVDVDNVIKGKKGDGKIEDNTLLLQPGDIIYVPERLI